MNSFRFQPQGARDLRMNTYQTRTAVGGTAPAHPWRSLLGLSLVLGWCLVHLMAANAFAQGYTIDWYSIDGGGGTSTGAVYSVTATIGQVDAGAMSGTNYSVTGGFWSVVAALQTPGGPLLSVFRSATNTVIISWPSPSTGFALQQNSNVANTNGWSAYGGAVNDDGTNRSATLSAPTGNVFFRLIQ